MWEEYTSLKKGSMSDSKFSPDSEVGRWQTVKKHERQARRLELTELEDEGKEKKARMRKLAADL